MSITIKDALIVTMNDQNEVFMGNIVIEGSDITQVSRTDGPSFPEGRIAVSEDSTVINGNGCLALPGLINGHIHSYRNCLRFVPAGIDRLPRLNDPPDKPDLSYSDAKAILALSYLEAVKAGVTYCCDFPQWLEDFPAQDPFEIARSFGLKGCIRVVLSHDSYDRAKRGYFTESEPVDPVRENEYLEADKRTIEAVANTITQIGGGKNYQIGIWMPWETRGRRNSDKFNVRTLHFLTRLIEECESEDWNKGVPLIPLMHFAEYVSSTDSREFHRFVKGYPALTRRMALFHSIHINQEDIKLIRNSDIGGSVTCPKFTNGRLSPAGRMIDAGIAVGIGTDFGPWNLLPAIGLVPKLHRCFEETPQERPITISEALRMATKDGAKVYGLDEQIGSIEVGKRADIVLIERNELPGSLPVYLENKKEQEAIEQFVNWNAICDRDVHTVVIDGEMVIKDRRLRKTQLDENATVTRGCEAIKRVHEKIRMRPR